MFRIIVPFLFLQRIKPLNKRTSPPPFSPETALKLVSIGNFFDVNSWQKLTKMSP